MLAIGAVVSVILLMTSSRSAGSGSGSGEAESLANEYVQMIADGNAKRANEIARIDLSDENNIMLTDAVLSKAERITGVSVSGFYGTRTSASVEVAYKLESRGYERYVELKKDDDGWYVSRGLPYSVSGSLPSIWDVEFGVPGLKGALDQTRHTQVAYPAVYKLTNSNKFTDVSSGATMTVGPDADRAKGVTASPSQAYLDAVAALIKKNIDECRVHTQRDELRECGLMVGYPSGMTLSGTSYAVAVTEYPTVTPAKDGSFGDFTVAGGAMTAQATGIDYQGAPATGSVEVDVRKRVSAEIVDGKVALR
ncbi:hypothetical protein ACFRFH_13735 [Leifsonia sp. NPDC056824]|uniref:hypothetical protein n=1 Tax=Leifsonia sp. NPDC056824 TaxID=3345953 RepID=UPI0036972744